MPANRIFSTVLALFVFASATGAGKGAAAQTPNPNAIRAHLEFLADDLLSGRDTGSPEFEIAARYVAAHLRSLNLDPAGDKDSYLQTVPFLRNQLDQQSAQVEVRRGDEVFALEWKKDFVMSGDAVRAETSITAPVVFVGHGVVAPEMGYDDYDGVDVEGRIVLMLNGAPASFPHNQRAYYSQGSAKTREAVERGAVGILSFRSAERAEKYPWEKITRNAGRAGLRWLSAAGEASDHSPQIQCTAALNHQAVAMLLEGSGHTLEELLQAGINEQLESFALPVEVTLGRRTEHQEVSAFNVAAILSGSDPELQNEYLVYTAHLDHVGVGAPVDGDAIYNGAYDNAMGVSVMLEVARLFAASPQRPKRSILFLAVTGEEKGLLGAEYFARYPTVPKGSIVANVNLDMPLFLYPLADVTAFGAEHSTLEGPVRRAAEAVGLALTPDPTPEEVLFIRSDQYAFVEQGVPAIFFVTGMQSSDPEVDGAAIVREFLVDHYHTPSDDLTRPVDWDSAARFTQANFLLGLEVADATERPTWNEGDFFGEKFGR